jgi:hypothetical protein
VRCSCEVYECSIETIFFLPCGDDSNDCVAPAASLAHELWWWPRRSFHSSSSTKRSRKRRRPSSSKDEVSISPQSEFLTCIQPEPLLTIDRLLFSLHSLDSSFTSLLHMSSCHYGKDTAAGTAITCRWTPFRQAPRRLDKEYRLLWLVSCLDFYLPA